MVERILNNTTYKIIIIKKKYKFVKTSFDRNALEVVDRKCKLYTRAMLRVSTRSGLTLEVPSLILAYRSTTDMCRAVYYRGVVQLYRYICKIYYIHRILLPVFNGPMYTNPLVESLFSHRVEIFFRNADIYCSRIQTERLPVYNL